MPSPRCDIGDLPGWLHEIYRLDGISTAEREVVKRFRGAAFRLARVAAVRFGDHDAGELSFDRRGSRSGGA